MGSSFEQSILVEVVGAAREVGLELVLVGNAAAALQAVPVTTRDVDFFVRDTAANHRKIEALAERLGGLAITRPGLPLSRMVRLVGMPVEIDFVFVLSGGARFESVRSRAIIVQVGSATVPVACLADVISSKKAAARPKDLAVLPILEQTERVLAVMREEQARLPSRRKNVSAPRAGVIPRRGQTPGSGRRR